MKPAFGTHTLLQQRTLHGISDYYKLVRCLQRSKMTLSLDLPLSLMVEHGRRQRMLYECAGKPDGHNARPQASASGTIASVRATELR